MGREPTLMLSRQWSLYSLVALSVFIAAYDFSLSTGVTEMTS